MRRVVHSHILRLVEALRSVRRGSWVATRAAIKRSNNQRGWRAEEIVCSVPASVERAALLDYLASCSPDAMETVLLNALRYEAIRAGAVEDVHGNPLQCFAQGERLAVVEKDLDEAADRALREQGLFPGETS